MSVGEILVWGIVVAFIACIAGAMIAFFPLITIWALNTLFPVLGIVVSFKTWFAMLWLTGTVGGVTGAIVSGIAKSIAKS